LLGLAGHVVAERSPCVFMVVGAAGTVTGANLEQAVSRAFDAWLVVLGREV
jgi:hypothetical protein